MEVFDRIDIPVTEQVPGAKDVKDLASWTIPNTEITIARVAEGPRKGEFLFSPETVSRAEDYFDQVAQLPYKDGTVLRNAHQVYLQAPGPLIAVAWVEGMPSWLRGVVLGQPLWKWIALLIVLLSLVGGLVLAFRLGSRKHENDPRAPFRRRVVFPVSGICLAWLAAAAIGQINVVREVMFFTSIVTTLLLAVSLLWLVIIVTDAIAEAIVATPRINSKSIDAQMVRILFRLVSVGAFVLIVLQTAHVLGVPLTPVLAGLGVGGIAIALAAQNSIENLIGGFNLFTDRPIRVGDFCRFGQRLGTVEEIGLRSTRIRSLDDTVIAVPNSTFSKMELENYSRRRKIWYHPRIQLDRNATPDQVRFVLVEVRKMLYAHPKVDPEPARIRFAEFGAYSLDLEIFAYVTVADYDAYLAVAEDLNLRMLDILARAGVSLAVPVQRTLLERADSPDERRVQQTEKQVQEWRENNQLYLPSFPEDVISQLRESLDYPPRGAPGADGARHAP
jgi:MscS family membrane protein